MDPNAFILVLQQQRNAAMDNVALIAIERDALKAQLEQVKAELELVKQGEVNRASHPVPAPNPTPTPTVPKNNDEPIGGED